MKTPEPFPRPDMLCDWCGGRWRCHCSLSGASHGLVDLKFELCKDCFRYDYLEMARDYREGVISFEEFYDLVKNRSKQGGALNA